MSEPADSELQRGTEDVSEGDGQLTAALRQLDAFAQEDSRDALETVFDHYLTDTLDESTFRIVRDAGILLMGEPSFAILVWLADHSDRSEALADLDVSQDAKKWLGRILAVFGDRLTSALHLSDVIGSRRGDWDEFGRQIHRDLIGNEYEITIEIRKFDGDRLVIEAGVSSIARLTQRFMETLMRVDDLGEVSPSVRSDLQEMAGGLLERLTQEAEEIEQADQS